ncbi:MAG TPA: hypothetical protein VHT03_01400 [Rhizomicrobium sp.]|jgi:hypothetical protein|nr:hypothetical protein [Rhizomicrobium sp.]
MKRSFILLLASSVLAFGGAAQACDLSQALHRNIPRLVLPEPSAAIRLPADTSASRAVVGTWLVNLSVNGNTIAQALVQWHDDGTEWQSISQPVDSGNVCMGSWKAVDLKHVYRYHMGWTYSSGTLSGYIIETETDRVTAKGTYKGDFDTKFYDTNGNLVNEITGTTAGTKLNP